MKRRTLLAGGIAAASLAAPALRAQSTTEVKVLYSIPDLFKTLHEQIAAEFMKANPQYKITFLAPQPAYEEIAQATLRAAVTNTLPDVAYQGLNRQRIFFDRGLAQPLDALIAADPDFKTFGHSPGLLDVGRFGGKQLGIGFSVSTPIIYYNADLVTKAGGDPDCAAGRLGRHLRARRARSRRWAARRRASTSTGTSPATGCGRRWSSPTAAPC